MQRHRIAIVALLLASSGCATKNLSVEQRGSCSILKQAGYSASVRIEASSIKWLNAGPSAMTRVSSIALAPSDQDKEAGIVAMYLDLDSTAVVESCQRILADKSSCVFRDGSLVASGFSFRAVGESRAEPQAVLARSKVYWSMVSACK
ncbi:hypothetical protein ACS5PN_15235 [Roseateles sp. NT4]|uniref:hypothetical protein n=1 Tax=Roseateles sp. NT4 TaxID=3453715 RepID=UPI003EEB781B